MNPAQELQAVGRVHRIGQEKATVVHKFVIKSTIEERMYNMLRYTQNTNRQKRKKVKELQNENETRKESKREKKERKKEGRK